MFDRDYSKLSRAFEIVSETKNKATIHIASQQMIDDIFTLKELSGVVHQNHIFMYTACGKVSVLKDERESIRYIIDESKTQRMVKIENDKI